MKKIISIILAVLITASGGSAFATDIIMQTDENSMVIDNTIELDFAPFEENGIVYLPLTPILDAFGISYTTEGTALKTDKVNLQADKDIILLNGRPLVVLSMPVMKDNVLYLSTTLVSYLFELDVILGGNGIVKITDGSKNIGGDGVASIAEAVPEGIELMHDKALEYPEGASDLDKMLINVTIPFMDPHSSPEAALKYYRASGYFSDINYEDPDSTDWQPMQHLERLRQLTAITYCPSNRHYNDPELKKIIADALSWWVTNDIRQNIGLMTGGWFDNVAVPNYLVDIVTFKPEGLSEEVMEKIMKKVDVRSVTYYDPPLENCLRNTVQTGNELANEIKLMMATILLSNESDEEKTDKINVLLELINGEFSFHLQPLFCTSDDPVVNFRNYAGLQADYCFLNHGVSNLLVSYGMSFYYDVSYILDYLENTSFQLSDDAMNHFANLLYFGFDYHMRGGKFWPNTAGRGAAGYVNDYNAERFRDTLRIMAKDERVKNKGFIMDMYNRYTKLSDITRDEQDYSYAKIGNRHYYTSDVHVHHRTAFSLGIRGASNLSVHGEFLNGQGEPFANFGDGSYFLLRRDRNFDEHLAVYQYDKVSGTTMPLNVVEWKPAEAHRWATQIIGAADVAGGVSDGLYGMFMFDHARLGVTAKKSYFSFDDEVVCLGAGVSSSHNNEVYTTINQTELLDQKVTVNAGSGAQVLDKGTRYLDNVSWVLHDGVGYVLPTPTRVEVKNDSAEGSMWLYNMLLPEDMITRDMFIVGLNHGKKPSDETYEYIMVMDTDEAGVEAYSKNPAIEVAANTKAVQAVLQKDLNILQAAFFSAGSVTAGGVTVTVSKPCALMLKRFDDKYQLSVANPYNNSEVINVTLSGEINETVVFDLDAGYRGYDGGRTKTYDSNDGFIVTDASLENDLEKIEDPARLLAMTINGESSNMFGRDSIGRYYVGNGEKPEIKAWGNYPVTINVEETKAIITVKDPSNPLNERMYIMMFR